MEIPFFNLGLLRYRELVRQRKNDGLSQLWDPLRKKWVSMEPEEWVRQLLICYLIEEKGASVNRMMSERQLRKRLKGQRFDLGLYDPDGRLAMLAECKSFRVKLNAEAIGQLSRYNRELRSPLLFWTNGLDSCCARLNDSGDRYAFIDHLPEI